MKITFTREEVEAIVLRHVILTMTAKVNTCHVSSYSTEFATLTYAEAEPAEATSAQPAAEAA